MLFIPCRDPSFYGNHGSVSAFHEFGGQQIAVELEQSRGPLVFMLAKYEHRQAKFNESVNAKMESTLLLCRALWQEHDDQRRFSKG